MQAVCLLDCILKVLAQPRVRMADYLLDPGSTVSIVILLRFMARIVVDYQQDTFLCCIKW